MTEQPNQQPYPYGQPQVQQPYQNPYQQPGQQPPYPQQQYGAPQPYPQVPPQQYQGQQFPGQQPYGYQPPAPGQPLPQDPAQAQAQNQPKPKKKRSRWAIFFIVLFSPFIAVIFVLYGIFWVLAWLLTPVAMVLHFVFCGIGLIWYSGVKVLASGRSKYRLFQPVYPKFPPFWTGAYWVRLNKNVRSTGEGLAAIAQLLDW